MLISNIPKKELKLFQSFYKDFRHKFYHQSYSVEEDISLSQMDEPSRKKNKENPIEIKQFWLVSIIIKRKVRIFNHRRPTDLLEIVARRRKRKLVNLTMYSRSKKNEISLFISIQIIVQKWSWYQSLWIIVYFNLML